ncbi:N-acyl-phosphatidylethanolamine-hydrolyzing phospholipase D [Sphaceloma murrayae]|uniref:N-acyl-phosphatidylethanolamine-hydrolyzing phospholipase D n=1 Tax=Sphaceloma murrayae TaxID=2082308 RepID=A0A2K1QLK7_9PEZI|nr:N-acyl-phosphatidylethanolamine-hydrolyzing phospholipase D [Sphaceloma murrayae]
MEGPLTSPIFNAIVSSSPSSSPSVPANAKDLAHHEKSGKGFINPWESRKLKGEGKSPDTTPPTVPVRKPTFLTTRKNPHLRTTWLGHACYYVEFPSGLRVLFDPVFTDRCSPLSWLGPKRYTEMPCQIRDIPFIDAVIISHNHYDHLSHPTILEIQRLHPNCHFFAPLGNKQWFDKSGVHKSTELDWWQSTNLTLTQGTSSTPESRSLVVEAAKDVVASDIEATIQCLPCQHMSARSGWDKSQTLWASWAVTSGTKKLWFGGDTGYRSVPKLPVSEDDYDAKYDFPRCPAFKEIGEHAGPFDVGLIPIGAYVPRHVMSPMHANPFDSVNIFADTRCRRALGMHWGTWVLTEEDVMEPPRLLREALKKKGLGEQGVFDVCDIGESREFKEER